MRPQETAQRTDKQNKALHLFLAQLAEALNDAGYDIKAVMAMFKEGMEVPFTPITAKELLWRPVQQAMYKKLSTTELDKHKEITEIHKVLMTRLSEKTGIEYIPFPFECKSCSGLSEHYEDCPDM